MSANVNPYNAGSVIPHGSPLAPAAGEITEVAYELDVDDLVELTLHNQKRSPTIRRQQVVAVALLAVPASLLIGSAAMGGFDGIALVVTFCAVFVFSFLLTRATSKRVNRRLVRKVYLEGSNRALLGARRLRLAPEGLQYSSSLIETAAKWAAVERIETTDEYAFLYIAAVQAYIVPRRAFGDEAHFKAFVELARRFRQQAPGELSAV